MDSNKFLKIIIGFFIIISGAILMLDPFDDPSPTVDENLNPTVTDEARQVNDEIYYDGEKERNMSFEHVQPGVYSEVYYTVGNLEPNTVFKATMSQLDLELGDSFNPREQEAVVDEFGVARFVWRIDQFGDYNFTDQEFGPEVSHGYVEVR